MARTIKFNMNDTVRVKLTDHGRRLHRKQFDDLRNKYPAISEMDYSLDETESGWSEWLLWDLMHTFGSEVCMGLPNVFETTIELVVDD